MRRKELKSRKKLHKYKKLITGVKPSWKRKKESILEEYTPEVSAFELMRNPREENKKIERKG